MRNIVWLLIMLFFSVMSNSVLSQSGNIQGNVRDSRTREVIIGANVVIEGTTIGTSTNIDGLYSISNLEPGEYNLVISFVSYHKQRIDKVSVGRGQTVLIDIMLEEDIALLEGVHVRSRRVKHNDLALLSTMKASEIVVSGISAQQISRSQDNDASMVIKRIPGVTVVDDRFIMIRGLSERYNPTILQHTFAPSMEADVRSFSFDIIPSSLIDQILIYKSPSAELPGEFAGGIVRVLTRNIPESNYLHASYSASYDPNTSFSDFYRPETSNLHWLGFNDKKYDLPGDFPANLRSINDPEEITRIGRTLQNNWKPTKNNAGVNHSAMITNALRFKSGDIIFGNITSVTYYNKISIDDVGRMDFNVYDRTREVSSMIYDFNDRQNNQKIRTGLLHNWGVSFGPDHSIEFRNLFNQLSTTQYVYRTGRHIEFGYNADNHSFHQVYRGIYAGQLAGKHNFFDGQTTIEWVGGYGNSFRDEPDYRRYRSDLDTSDQSLTLYIPFGAAQTYFMGRFYSEMKETNYTGALNAKHQFQFRQNTNFQPEISAGIFCEDKSRRFDSRNLGYVRSNSTLFDENLRGVSVDSLFHPLNINGTTGLRIDEQTNPSDSYSAHNKLWAGYVQLSVPVTRNIRIAGGIRLEGHQQNFNSFTLTNDPVNVDREIVSILPSAYIGYNFTQKMLVRFAYGKTLNRPEFRELAPFGFYDFSYNLVKKGNPDLKTAIIHNFDLRWEFYPSPREIIMAGVFYKRFTDPIESSFVPGAGTAGTKIFTYSNADRAESMGIEIEIRKSIHGLTSNNLLNKFFIVLNTALINSEVELGRQAGLGQSYTERPMQGQSPFIVNTGIYYTDTDRNIQASLLYNIIGKRIFMIGYDDYPEIYEMPRNLLDLTIIKGIGDNLELKFGIRDLLNQKSILLQDGNQDGAFNRRYDQVIERFSPGTTYSFGLTFRF